MTAGGPDIPPDDADASGDTSPPTGGAPDWLTPGYAIRAAHQRAMIVTDDSVEYWKRRALAAEARLASQSWVLEEYREERRRQRDREIGEMGGGG